MRIDKIENSNWEREALVDNFPYSSLDTEFVAFASWIENILSSQTFLDKLNEFIEIEQKLKNQPSGKKRSELVSRFCKIKYG